MGQNKAQKEAAARAKKQVAEVGPTSDAIADLAAKKRGEPEQPKAEVKATPATPALPSKQDATLAKLKAGWEEKKVDLSKMTVKDDGKFKNVIVAEGWPTVRIGASGGIAVLELKSYPDAFTGAMEGLERYTKQKARDEKAVAAASQPVAKTATKSEPAQPAVPVKARAA